MSCGNDGPWKAWKAKNRLPTLSTVLGKLAKAASFPHSHSFGDWSSYKERLSKAGLTAEPKTVNFEGGPEQTAEVGQKQLPNATMALPATGNLQLTHPQTRLRVRIPPSPPVIKKPVVAVEVAAFGSTC